MAIKTVRENIIMITEGVHLEVATIEVVTGGLEEEAHEIMMII